MTYSTEIDEISLDLLHSGDEEEADRLLEACIRDGVFYLNLRQQDDERIESPLIRYADHIFDASKSLFDLPLEKKMKYDIDRNGDLKLNGQVLTFTSTSHSCNFQDHQKYKFN